MNNFNNNFAMQWWMNEEKKRKERANASSIHQRVNTLNRIIRELDYKYNLEDTFPELIETLNRNLGSCSVLNIQYANNYEAIETLASQVVLLEKIHDSLTPFEQAESISFTNRFIAQSSELRTYYNQYKQQVQGI